MQQQQQDKRGQQQEPLQQQQPLKNQQQIEEEPHPAQKQFPTLFQMHAYLRSNQTAGSEELLNELERVARLVDEEHVLMPLRLGGAPGTCRACGRPLK